MKMSRFAWMVGITVVFAALAPLARSADILTPPAPPAPRINGPSIYGQRPGRPFLYRIPATGKRPMSFAADALPQGLTLDSKTGQISGKVHQPGESQVTLRATNDNGTCEKKFKIVIGD